MNELFAKTNKQTKNTHMGHVYCPGNHRL